MTERDKLNFSEKLFDEIGLIDDRFIYEAGTPYVSRARRGWGLASKIIAIAAALTLTLCVSVGALFTGALFIIVNSDGTKGDAAQPPADNITNDAEGYPTLSSQLSLLGTGGAYATVTPEALDLFDSTPKVIWKAVGEEKYSVCEINYEEASALTGKLKKSAGTAIPTEEREERADVLVWIALGDGRVITPHLALTSGNVGYGELFDYVQEYEPSEDFSDLLIDTLS